MDAPESPSCAPCAATPPEPVSSSSSDWPSDAAFACSERVELRRTDGSFSIGRVRAAYEGCFGLLYQVQLDNGVFKQAVSESELFRPSGHEDDGTDAQARTLLMWMEAQLQQCDG